MKKYEDIDITTFIPEEKKKQDNPDSKGSSKIDSEYSSNISSFSSETQDICCPAQIDVPTEYITNQEIPSLEDLDELTFKLFDDSDIGISSISSSIDEAFGIITTGIETIEITPTGAVITGYIKSARRNDIRL